MLKNFLDVQPGDKIAFAGAGGKTTAIMKLAQELVNFKVLIATTTKMYWEKEAVELTNSDELSDLFAKQSIVITGKKIAQQKMGSYDLNFLAKLTNFSDVTLIEADGAKRKPFKFPREYEPVYPDFVNKIVYVVGMNALNEPLMNLARGDLLQIFLAKKAEAKLTTDDIIKVLLSKQGAKKAVKDRDFYVILNQVDTDFLAEQANIIAKTLMQHKIKVLLSSFEVK